MREGVKTAEISDFDLTQKCKGGDHDAFEQLRYRHQASVFILCRRMTSADVADDLAQETWFKVFEKINQFRNEAAFSTWLHRVAVSICLQYIRKNRRGTTLSEEQWRNLENLNSIFAERTPDSHEILELDDLLKKFMAILKASDRNIFIACFIEEMEPREVAPLLNISPKYVSNQFGKLKKRLANFICDQKRKGGDTKI